MFLSYICPIFASTTDDNSASLDFHCYQYLRTLILYNNLVSHSRMFRSLERRCQEKDRVLVGVLLEEARNQRATRLWSSQGVLLEILVASLYLLISFKLYFMSNVQK